MEITRSMYLLAKKIVEEYEGKETVKKVVLKTDIEDRKINFIESIRPYKHLYPSKMLNDFYEYWAEPNKSNTKFKQEMQKTWDLERRLRTWAKNDKNFNNGKQNSNQKSAATYNRSEAINSLQTKFGSGH